MASQSFNPPKIKDRTIEDFKAKLIGGAARPNLFEVELAFPSFIDLGTAELDRSRFMVKAAALPASNINVIDVPFRGRNLKIAGDRTFDVWTITVINDISFNLRNAFEQWMNGINKHDNATGFINPSQYQKDAFVYQLGRNTLASTNGFSNDIKSGLPKPSENVPVLKKYVFHGVFPTNVSAIELSYDSSDTIEEFTVDLQVQWWDAYDDKNENLFATDEEPIDTPDSQGS
mgnify:FL=1|jgi:hypothetical protein|tara:strand:- start:79 stop:771 length:693 start_codon:yes stop_codon:yes gene_type:complete